MRIVRPMKCCTLRSVDQLEFPALATPKLDGIRALNVGGRAVTRSFKPVRNPHARELVERLPEGVDGELVLPGGSFSDTQSAVMSWDGPPGLVFQCFDWACELPYVRRVRRMVDGLAGAPGVELVVPVEVCTAEEFDAFERDCLSVGYEGVVVRSPTGPYKCGRSTAREGYMFKHKPSLDGEAVILGVKEARENRNMAVPNNFGLCSRPGGSAGKVPKGTLGGFLVQDMRTGTVFQVGTGKGLTHELRARLWAEREALVGRVITYEYQELGSKGRPRFPKFVRFRDD